MLDSLPVPSSALAFVTTFHYRERDGVRAVLQVPQPDDDLHHHVVGTSQHARPRQQRAVLDMSRSARHQQPASHLCWFVCKLS